MLFEQKKKTKKLEIYIQARVDALVKTTGTSLDNHYYYNIARTIT